MSLSERQGLLVMACGCKCQEKCIADEWLLSGNLCSSDAATKNGFDIGNIIFVKRMHINIKAGEEMIYAPIISFARCFMSVLFRFFRNHK